MTQGREPLEEAGGVFAKGREEFEEWCRLEAGDREGWARVWGPEGVDLKLASDPDVSPWIRCEGFWEAWITLGIARRIHDGATVWNIGANVGYFTAMFALLAGHRGRVVAFEPQPDLAACIAASRRDARLRRIEVIDAAVGRYARKAQLFAGQTETGEVHRGGVSLFSSTKVKPIGSKVEVFAIDTLQDRFGKPDLIFCDAEGAEEEIFLGSELLTTHRPELCIEWCPQRYITPKSFVMFLNECGYSAYRFNENAIAVPFDLQASIDRDVLEQILLVPSGVAPRRRADKS